MKSFDMALSLYNPKGFLVIKKRPNAISPFGNFTMHQAVKEDYLVYDGYALFADTGGLARINHLHVCSENYLF